MRINACLFAYRKPSCILHCDLELSLARPDQLLLPSQFAAAHMAAANGHADLLQSLIDRGAVRRLSFQ